MNSFNLCISCIIVFTAATVFYTDAFILTQKESKRDDSIQFSLVGSIGSKSYFETNLMEKVNWLGARDICEKYGEMEFASVQNYEEFRYIYETRKGNDYWISASLKGFASEGMSGTHKSFEWVDGTDLPISGEIFFHHSPAFWICLYVSGDDHTYADLCTTGMHQVLCQVKN